MHFSNGRTIWAMKTARIEASAARMVAVGGRTKDWEAEGERRVERTDWKISAGKDDGDEELDGFYTGRSIGSYTSRSRAAGQQTQLCHFTPPVLQHHRAITCG
jgi:hypothetical protein